MTSKTFELADLILLMSRLRDPDTGCPWDIKQTFASIVPHTLEETYEVVDAIERGDYGQLREELGDLLFQIVFYSRLATEQDMFDFEEVVHALVEKLISRHPHVFPDGTISKKRAKLDIVEESQIKETWESLKQIDRINKGLIGRLADIPLALPALSRAAKLQKRAARHGFDWQEIAQVVDKLEEEVTELKDSLVTRDKTLVEEELGDLIFVCVNLARHISSDAETVLRKANSKFEKRFSAMEKLAEEQKVDFDLLSMPEKNQLWDSVKQLEKNR